MWKFLIFLVILACFNEGQAFPKDQIPAMARKAGGGGGRLRPELVKTTSVENAKEGDIDKGVGQSKADDKSASYEYSESEEVDCPRKKFYHLRGKKCVPLRCPGKRNHETGDCIDPYTGRIYNGRGGGGGGYGGGYNANHVFSYNYSAARHAAAHSGFRGRSGGGKKG